MRRAKTLTIYAGLAIIAAILAVVLSESPPKVLAANSTKAEPVAASGNGGIAACQPYERLPPGTTAIRLALAAFLGPRVKVKILSGGHIVASGERGSAWSGHVVTVPLRDALHTTSAVTVCFATVPVRDELIVYGSRTRQAIAARTSHGGVLEGRIKLEYLGAGTTSWFSLATAVARHMGLGRAWSGIWIAFFVATLTLAATVLACVLLVREPDE
jgi:hypothetical protein